MADDDDDKKKKHTLESLFYLYCNHIVIQMDVENEEQDCILLSQIDYWLDQAKLLKTVFTTTETGLTYMKFKKWRLDFEEFVEFLMAIIADKNMTMEELKQTLVEAGPPGGNEQVVVK